MMKNRAENIQKIVNDMDELVNIAHIIVRRENPEISELMKKLRIKL